MNNRFFAIIFVPLSTLLVIIALLSLKWHMVHDSPIFLYFAYLIDHFHYVPYRDFFDVNLPGTYLINLLLGHYFGYSDFAFRCFDLLYLSAILTMTWLWLKKIDWRVAWCSTVLFGLFYLEYGPIMSLQRDFCIILPVTAAILLASSFPAMNDIIKCTLVGFLFGIAATIKPHAPIAFPLVVLFQVWDLKHPVNSKAFSLPRFLKITMSSIIGFAIPLLVMFVYIWQVGALTHFLDIAKNYWPLFGGITGDFKTVFGMHRILYLIDGYFTLGSQALWLIPAGVGVYIALFRSTLTGFQKRHVLVLIGLAVLYSIYPVFAGKFWQYHWLLFYYFIISLSSLCFLEQSGDTNTFKRLLPVIIITLTIFFRMLTPAQFSAQFSHKGYQKWIPQEGRVGEIADYLKSHREADDKVQPLDFTGGAIHAMLLAQVEIATPFPYDFLFYHHLSNEYIKNLRKKFLEHLNASKPRFVIQVVTDRPWISGPDTTRTFEALQHLLDSYYSVSVEGTGYVIYERL